MANRRDGHSMAKDGRIFGIDGVQIVFGGQVMKAQDAASEAGLLKEDPELEATRDLALAVSYAEAFTALQQHESGARVVERERQERLNVLLRAAEDYFAEVGLKRALRAMAEVICHVTK